MSKLALFVAALLLGAGALGLAPSPAHALPILQIDSSGKLTGARKVDVGGTLYDVVFKDGSCVSLFSGCDSPSDFDFPSFASGDVAARALLNQVFLDSSLGAFGSNPALTNGCSNAANCYVIIPAVLASPEMYTNVALIRPGSNLASPSSIPPAVDTTYQTNRTWALFSPAVIVPEPGTLALFGLGIAGLAFARRKAPATA